MQASKEFVEKFDRWTTPLAGADKVLRTVSYVVRFIATSYLHRKPNSKSEWPKRLMQLGSSFSEARTIHRFVGLAGTLPGIWQNNTDDPLIWWLNFFKTWSMVVYYPMEHLYWLNNKKIIRTTKDPNWLSNWSCFAWAVYIVADIINSFYKLRKNLAASKELATHKQQSIEKQLALRNERTRIFVELIKNWADLPNAVTWSFDLNTPAPAIWGFGSISSLAGVYLSWTNLA
ncbi:Peroxisomal biogenesis factor 11 (PEX11) [Balamuthia mandrillaris]